MRKQQRRKRRRDGAKEAYWRGQVAGQARSELSVRAFCRQQGLAENLFYAWRRQLALRDREQMAARETTPTQAFAEVVVTAPAEPRMTASTETATATIEIILSSRRRIAISPGFDPATLTAVLDLLEQRPC